MTDSEQSQKRKLSPPRRASLTKRYLDSLRPEAKDFFVWDDDLPGFGVRVRVSGRRSYEVQYRLDNGRQRRRVIGTYPPMPLPLARKDAKAWLVDAQRGGDPADVIDRQRKSLTLAKLCDTYLKDHAALHKKARSAAEDQRIIERYIKPKLGGCDAASITQEDIKKLHRSYRDRPYQANRVLALLSTVFNTQSSDLREKQPHWANPCRDVKRFAEEQRRRYLTSAELASLGAALTGAERDGTVSPTVVAAIRLLLFTGCRLSEILTLEWDHVNFERRCLALPDSKSGAKDVFLNAPALEVLSGLDRVEGNRFVIPGRIEGDHMQGLKHAWLRIRERAGLDDVRLHDLRHSFASVGAGVGLSLPIIGGLLGHSQASTTQRYAHLAASPLHEAADLVGKRLAEAMAGDGSKAESAEVVSLARGRKDPAR